MPIRRRAFLCHHCATVLTADDRLHYIYACHDCAVDEHDLILLADRDPDHPDVERLGTGPVDLGPMRSGTSGRPARCAA